MKLGEFGSWRWHAVFSRQTFSQVTAGNEVGLRRAGSRVLLLAHAGPQLTATLEICFSCAFFIIFHNSHTYERKRSTVWQLSWRRAALQQQHIEVNIKHRTVRDRRDWNLIGFILHNTDPLSLDRLGTSRLIKQFLFTKRIASKF